MVSYFEIECKNCKHYRKGMSCDRIGIGDVFNPYSGKEISCPEFREKGGSE